MVRWLTVCMYIFIVTVGIYVCRYLSIYLPTVASKRYGLMTAALGSQNCTGFLSSWLAIIGPNKKNPQSPIQGDGW